MSNMGKRRRRRLGDDERRLWELVAATANPLHPDHAQGAVRQSTTLRSPAESDHEPGAASTGSASGARGSEAPLSLRPSVQPPPRRAERISARVTWAAPEAAPVGRPQAGLDGRTAERLRKGARQPDARIDLHGMTAERAHGACLHFLSNAAAQGHRVVLVITGKGRRDENGFAAGRGILRESLPGWLRASPLGHSIVGIYEAHRRHGGAGAFYVYLKRRR